MVTNGSAFIRRQLGLRLVRLRENAGKTQADVATARVVARSTLSDIERGLRATRVGTIIDLLRYYGVTGGPAFDAIVALAEGALSDGWWEEQAGAAWPDWLQMYVGLEANAATVSVYEPGLVAGIAQIEEYARAVIASNTQLTEEVVSNRVASRMKRRPAVLDRPEPARLEVILREPAIQMEVGDPSLLVGQVAFLRELDEMPTVTVAIIPTKAPPRTRLGGAFTILDFDDPEDPDLVYSEDYFGSKYMEQHDILTGYREVFGLLRDSSIPIKEYSR